MAGKIDRRRWRNRDGVILETVLIQGCRQEEAKTIIKVIEDRYSCSDEETAYDITNLAADQCQYREYADGVSILINEDCIGYEELAEAISSDFSKVVMLLYIYDGDFLGVCAV